MNNRQNGRRRGRGGQQARNGQPGSPDRGNRLDNRARGNAAQLLEKYKNLARDAQMQGDRVNTEYYLQFADHYFRVLNENRARFEEQRPRQNDYRDDFGGEGGEEEGGEAAQQQRFHGREDQGDDDGWDDGDQPQVETREPRRERQASPNDGERGERPERQSREGGRERGRRNGNGPSANVNVNSNGNGNGNGFSAPDFLSEPISPRYDLSADDSSDEESQPTQAAPQQDEAAPKRRRAPRRPRSETTAEA